MEPVDIRKLLLDVPIPKKEEEGARAFVIGKLPAIAPMLKDLRGETNEYGSGLATAMSRIIQALEKASVPDFLSTLKLDDVYSADQQLRDGWNIESEYPTIAMANVLALGAFGAGVCLAFALVELAMVRVGMASSSPATITGLEDSEEIPEEGTESLTDMGPTLTKKPHPGHIQAASKPHPGRIQAASKKPAPKAPEPPPIVNLNEGIPLVTLNVYKSENGFKIVGDVAPTLEAMAQASAVVRACFNTDANVVADRRGNLSFSFGVISEGV